MCGIAGYVVREGNPRRWADELGGALRALIHRGPDDEGAWFDADRAVGLGHRRLSIVDLSPLGHQPMVSHCGRWVMAYNGEVYNFGQIRPELEALGHRFAGHSDSEVILNAIAQWGLEAVNRFVGMFSIALWSVEQRTLYLLRDRLGVKPLYYGWDGRTLHFGSELKALRAFSGWSPQIDRDALTDFFRYGYIGSPRSIYQGVHKLPPGHWLELRPEGEPVVHRYWSVLDAAGHKQAGSEDELADRLEALLIDAFRLRMIADVPVGLFLSGGIDSSLLAAVLQRHAGQTIKTFTIGFDEPDKNEAPHAEAVARHLGTEHVSRTLRVDEAMAMLPEWGDLYDEPFGDASGIPTLLVSKMAAEQVKVVLSADGGDELFCGYRTYANLAGQWQRLSSMPTWLRQGGAAMLGAAPWDALGSSGSEVVQRRLVAPARKVRDRLGARGIGDLYDRAQRACNWPDAELARLLGRSGSTRSDADAFAGQGPEALCLWDLHNYLPDDVLVKVDRATMRASIEGRDPMIDHRIVEFAFALPLPMRQGALGPKHLLRKLLYRYVPRELVDRPKQGFGLPMDRWLKTGLSPLVEHHLDAGRLRTQGLLDVQTVQRARARMAAGDPDAVQQVWLALAFQMWFDRWMN